MYLDANWYEGHIGHKEGIFPVQYIQVLKEPETSKKSVEHRFKKSFFLKFEKPFLKPIEKFESLWKESDRKAQKEGLHSTFYSTNKDELIDEWHNNKK